MIPIARLFETHLTVEGLERSIDFYEGVLRLPLAGRFDDRKLLAMLPDAPNPELGILDWTTWQQQIDSAAELAQSSSPVGGLP